MINILGDTSQCADQSEHCMTWMKNEDCTRLPDYMAQNCKKACQLCGAGNYILTLCLSVLLGKTSRVTNRYHYFQRVNTQIETYDVLRGLKMATAPLTRSESNVLIAAPSIEMYHHYPSPTPIR